ncbi:hypothetical protein KEM60_00617 [Austwickia sp. TVS 96-490-7B]|uniref:hypothetical protein n=1 Tax=Austwickia sp. TVS 96-490-7B TaxID=2830843 RepID=UPI001C566FF8|nr:hypothetical protein [Austwickia sp. TVS 96-490-7B]MBW3084430.1 hypothetical protein [Austwickia sp. TVS 96-490-7B]
MSTQEQDNYDRASTDCLAIFLTLGIIVIIENITGFIWLRVIGFPILTATSFFMTVKAWKSKGLMNKLETLTILLICLILLIASMRIAHR